MERGAPYCYVASPRSVALLDPYWIGGSHRHTKRTNIKTVIILRRDPIAKAVEVLDPETALRHVEEGRGRDGRAMPFLNPHLLVRSMERIELQRRFYRRLFDIANVHAINVQRLQPREAESTTRSILGI